MMEPVSAEHPCPEGMWIGVDFDGTLVEYRSGTVLKTIKDVPPAVVPMVRRVMSWLDLGFDVRIFTSRASRSYPDQRFKARSVIKEWCLRHFGCELPITCLKDSKCYQIWDDRAIQVRQGDGRIYSNGYKFENDSDEVDSNPFGNDKPTVPEILITAADTYASRNPMYGDAYKRHGAIMAAFFDKGLHIEAGDVDAFARLGILNMLMSKLARYTGNPKGHKDSAHDSVVYNAMLEELTPDA